MSDDAFRRVAASLSYYLHWTHDELISLPLAELVWWAQELPKKDSNHGTTPATQRRSSHRRLT